MKKLIIFAVTILAVALTACGNASTTPPTQAPIQAQTQTVLPTVTTAPTDTPLPTATATIVPTTTPEFSSEAAGFISNIGPLFTLDQLSNPASIPFEEMSVLQSSAYAEALVYLANNGGLPTANKATAFPYQIVYPVLEDNFGYSFLQDSDRSYRSEYRDAAKIPYAPILIRRSEVEGKTVFVTYYSFVNRDGSVGVLGMAFFAREQYLADFRWNPVAPDEGKILNFRVWGEYDSCKTEYSFGAYTPDMMKVICTFYLSQENVDLDQALINWSGTGNLVNKTATGYTVPILDFVNMSLPAQ